MNKEARITKAVSKDFKIISKAYNAYGIVFETTFKNKHVEIEVITFGNHCEHGGGAFSPDLLDDADYEKAETSLIAELKEIKKACTE